MATTPTDPTKAQVWITGQAPNQQFEFYIPRGAKGEPGGFTTGTLLELANLNDIRVPGLYRQTGLTGATTLNNYPKPLTGVLEVLGRDTNILVQRYTPILSTFDVPTFYERVASSSTTWTAWRAYASQRVDQTAGRAIYTWDEVNNREQLIYGDTGWRDISATAFAPTFTGQFLVRRIGYTVQCSIRVDIADGAASGVTLATLTGAGYTPNNLQGEYVSTRPSASATQIFYRYTGAGVLSLASAWPAGGSSLYVNIAYMTNDSWPTSLPGTANATIPNT
jgi:hypothetical protein